jgi:hypothetical protein
MNKNITVKHLAGFAALACALTLSTASAQQAPAPAAASAPTNADLSYGLLGQNYSGVRYSYVHQSDLAPRALRRYGFTSNMNYLRGVDTTFNYEYRDGGQNGNNYQWHNLGAAATGYLTDLGDVRPFATADVGWRWRKIGDSHESGFAYFAGVGAEVAVAPGLSVAPFTGYDESSRLHEHVWRYGANANYRFTREWSALVGLEGDQKRSISYNLGVNRHF